MPCRTTHSIAQFGRWFEEAKGVVKDLPEAMMLATASRDGEVSVRSILLKEFDHRGFVFSEAAQETVGRRDGVSPG